VLIASQCQRNAAYRSFGRLYPA